MCGARSRRAARHTLYIEAAARALTGPFASTRTAREGRLWVCVYMYIYNPVVVESCVRQLGVAALFTLTHTHKSALGWVLHTCPSPLTAGLLSHGPLFFFEMPSPPRLAFTHLILDSDDSSILVVALFDYNRLSIIPTTFIHACVTFISLSRHRSPPSSSPMSSPSRPPSRRGPPRASRVGTSPACTSLRGRRPGGNPGPPPPAAPRLWRTPALPPRA